MTWSVADSPKPIGPARAVAAYALLTLIPIPLQMLALWVDGRHWVTPQWPLVFAGYMLIATTMLALAVATLSNAGWARWLWVSMAVWFGGYSALEWWNLVTTTGFAASMIWGPLLAGVFSGLQRLLILLAGWALLSDRLGLAWWDRVWVAVFGTGRARDETTENLGVSSAAGEVVVADGEPSPGGLTAGSFDGESTRVETAVSNVLSYEPQRRHRGLEAFLAAVVLTYSLAALGHHVSQLVFQAWTILRSGGTNGIQEVLGNVFLRDLPRSSGYVLTEVLAGAAYRVHREYGRATSLTPGSRSLAAALVLTGMLSAGQSLWSSAVRSDGVVLLLTLLYLPAHLAFPAFVYLAGRVTRTGGGAFPSTGLTGLRE